MTHKNLAQAFDRVKKCSDYVNMWLSSNNLKLNADKMQSITFATKKQREKLKKFFPSQYFLQFPLSCQGCQEPSYVV